MDVPALCAALVRIGFSANAATQITTVQVINSLTEVKLLRDYDVRALCKVIRHPAGLIPNPNANVAGQLALMPNPGLVVPLPAKLNLQLAAFYLCHQDKLSHPVTALNVTLVTVRAMRAVRDHEDAHSQPTELPKIDEKDMVKTFDAIDAYLRNYLGKTKIPLQYVAREDSIVIPSQNNPSTNYGTVEMELIARAPHEEAPSIIHPIYASDNNKVWEIMELITRHTNAWTWIKSHGRRGDGRAAYWSLYNHYLGASKTDNVQASAEGKLNNTTYQGEKRQFNFERYVQIHKEQHTALDGLSQHGYAPMDERTKVRLLLAGIRTNELDSVKAQVWANAGLCSDFSECVELFKTLIHQATTNATRSVNISAANSRSYGGRGGGRGGGGRGGRGRFARRGD
jgi:hypothetical protein